jgi:predicted O-linked N-acetylglucosamine transferase (SPINDLY family)
MRERLKRAFNGFIDIRDKSDREAAQLLRDREIDIAVNLKGFIRSTGRTGVFAHRPAPLQVNYLGYPGTMGADLLDYILGDAQVILKARTSSIAKKSFAFPTLIAQ